MYQNGPGLFGALNDEIPYADLDEGLRQRNVPAPDPPSDEQVGDTNNIHMYICIQQDVAKAHNAQNIQ